MSRTIILSSLVASIVCLAMTALSPALSFQAHASPASAQSVDRVAVVLRWMDAEPRGDLDTALAQFADNAVFIGSRSTGACSVQTPCTEQDGIRQQVAGNIANNICSTIRSVSVSGAVVTGVREIRQNVTRANGVERILQSFMAVLPEDKITLFIGVLDAADPLTALNSAITAGAQPARPPMPSPTEPCPGLL